MCLVLIAGLSVTAAVMRAYEWESVDEKTAMFLALAIVALLARQISKFEGFGIKFETVQKMVEEEGQRVREEIKGDVQQVEEKVNLIETTGHLPGRSDHRSTQTRTAARSVAGKGEDDNWASDPNKGNFGGSPESNGRRLRAEITPAAGPTSAACRVRFWVESTDAAKPLTTDVTFHLHPTFGRRSKYSVTPQNGIAEDTVTSWGAFTIGAVTDSDKTRLELDLAEVPGGTERFKQL